jgi:hypothetical protein
MPQTALTSRVTNDLLRVKVRQFRSKVAQIGQNGIIRKLDIWAAAGIKCTSRGSKNCTCPNNNAIIGKMPIVYGS